MTSIENFADQHRLRITRDACGDPNVQGRLYRDAVISEFDDSHLAMCWLTDGKATARTGLFNRVRHACLAAGMRRHQAGDAEGIFVFDPEDPVQARLAIKSVRARVENARVTRSFRLTLLGDAFLKFMGLPKPAAAVA